MHWMEMWVLAAKPVGEQWHKWQAKKWGDKKNQPPPAAGDNQNWILKHQPILPLKPERASRSWSTD
jgi:hypothetical protein